MKIKKITGIMLVMIMLTAMFSVAVGATATPEPTPINAASTIFMRPVTISGSANNPVTAEITIRTDGNGFSAIEADFNAIGWFDTTCLPNNSTTGWSARVKTTIQDNARELTLVLTGTPTKEFSALIKITMPPARFMSGTANSTRPSVEPTGLTSTDDSDVRWDIKPTHKIIMPLADSDDLKNGTLTASGATFRTEEVNGEDMRVAYVLDNTTMTFTATPKPMFAIDKWEVKRDGTDYTTGRLTSGANREDTNPEVTTITRRFVKANSAASMSSFNVGVDFKSADTAYWINDVEFHVRSSETSLYNVQQTKTNDEIKVNILKGGTQLTGDDAAVEIAFGDIPIIIEKTKVVVGTDLRATMTDITLSLPEAKEYILTINSSNTNVATVNVLTQAMINNPTTGLSKYTKLPANAATPGDLIIYPQNTTGKTTITITVTRTGTDNTILLKPGSIKFDVSVSKAGTIVTTPGDDKVDIDELKDNGILTATTLNAFGEKVELVLDLFNERAHVSSKTSLVTARSFSRNGTSWTALPVGNGENNKADISRMFDGAGTLQVAEKTGTSNRPAADSAIWEIAEIKARASTPRLKIWYGNNTPGEDNDDNTWTVTGHTFGEKLPGLLFATSADRKNPDADNAARGEFGFKPFDPEEPPEVKLLVNNKVSRHTYLFKVEATVDQAQTADDTPGAVILTPASKTVRLNVSSQTRPTRMSVNYRTERITLRAGTAYTIHASPSSITGLMTTADRKQGIMFVDNNRNIFTAVAPDGSVQITYWTAANGKKPQSAPETVKIWNYRKWNLEDTNAVEGGLDKAKGRYKLPRGYEIRQISASGATGKWTTSVRKMNTPDKVAFEVRIRGNARFDAKNPTDWKRVGTLTASESQRLEITFGEYTVKNRRGVESPKFGIIGASVTSLNLSNNN